MASQASPARVLLTRPADQGARFAADLRTRFGDCIDVLQSPLLSVRYLTPAIPATRVAAVIFTSENAIAASRPVHHLLPRTAYTVGDRTAAVARTAGFSAISASGDADVLVARIAADHPGPLLHLHGADTRGDVVPRLRAIGIEGTGITVYAQEEQQLSTIAQGWLADTAPVIVPLFSPRTAGLFAVAAQDARAALWTVSLSPAVDAAATLRTTGRRVAARPDAAAMLVELAAVLGCFTAT